MISASAYIKDNCLRVIGTLTTPYGEIPFNEKCTISGEAPNGEVSAEADLPENIETAFKTAHESIMSKLKNKNLALAAENLVERSRSGDQVATAAILMIGHHARGGNKRAKKAEHAIKVYIDGHPVKGKTVYNTFGEDVTKKKRLLGALTQELQGAEPVHYSSSVKALFPKIDDIGALSLVLANGPSLLDDSPHLLELFESLPDEHKHVFSFGLDKPNGEIEVYGPTEQTLNLAKSVSRAQRLQYARLPGTRLKHFCPMVGWEHGE